MMIGFSLMRRLSFPGVAALIALSYGYLVFNLPPNHVHGSAVMISAIGYHAVDAVDLSQFAIAPSVPAAIPAIPSMTA
jgi:hypothetical protein